MRQGRSIAATVLGITSAFWLTGCFTGGVNQIPFSESLTADLTAETVAPLARSQSPEPPDPKFRAPLVAPLIAP